MNKQTHEEAMTARGLPVAEAMHPTIEEIRRSRRYTMKSLAQAPPEYQSHEVYVLEILGADRANEIDRTRALETPDNTKYHAQDKGGLILEHPHQREEILRAAMGLTKFLNPNGKITLTITKE